MKTKLADLTAERQYLVAICTQPSDADRYPLEPGEFSDGECASVMRLILALRERNEPVSSADVIREARKTNVALDAEALLWGVEYLPAVSVHRRLRELATARRLRSAFASCVTECEALRVEVAEQIAHDVLDSMKKLSEPNVESSRDTVIRIVNEFSSGKKVTLVPTGITKIDLMIGGLEPGTLTFVGGDTGVGKSSLMLYMADRMMQCARRPGFISCEDSRQVLGSRILSAFSGVSGLKIRRGEFDRRLHEEALGVACDVVARRNMPIAYEVGSTDAQVAAAMSTLVRDHGCDVIFVDYIQTINCADGGENRREDIRRIASRIKGTAARLNVPVIVGSQITVGDIHSDFKEPGKHALKESRDLTNMAEWVIVIWKNDALHEKNVRERKPNMPKETPVEGKLAKSKCGGDGTRFTFHRDDSGVLVEVDEMIKEPVRASEQREAQHGW